METTISIDGKAVRLKCSAFTPLLYKNQFGTDLLKDMRSVAEEMKGSGAGADALPVSALNVFARMAYIMAQEADLTGMPWPSLEEWMNGFSPLFIYEILPVVQALWAGNLERLEEAKKKVGRLTEILQPRCSCSGPCSSECRCGTSH